MSTRKLELSQALTQVQNRIELAAIAAGRKSSDITLIAVTKTYPVTDVQSLQELGVVNFGENRNEEGAAKSAQVSAIWHFQGQVQSRKLREIATWANYLHSLDSPDHITKLSRICAEIDRKPSIFIQLSLDGAVNRGGVTAQALAPLARQISQDPNLHLAGLMCVPPSDYEYERAFGEIAKVQSAFVTNFPGADLLSAGMSNDFEMAIAYGATHLRIGSQILGSRTQHP